MRGILHLGRTMFIYGSVIGFWYLVIPSHILSMIVIMMSYGILGGIAFVIIGNVSIMLISMLNRRFKLARIVFPHSRRR
jgi:hypothetical protein